MAETTTLKSRIKHAYKTEADWTSSDPVLYAGEIGFSSDKGNMYKVGDGTSKWSALSYNKSNTTNTACALSYRGSVSATTDWDTLEAGIYSIAISSGGFTADYNQPVGAYPYGTLEVISNGSNITQRYTGHSNGQLWYRCRFSSNNNFTGWAKAYSTLNKPTASEIGAASSSHTHNYASSSSAGGSATSAVKLDSSAGSATQPVYFKDGKPVATTYTLEKSVPSNAVFTDTNTKVTQTVTTSNASYPLLLAPSGQAATATTTSYFDSGVTLNPSTNTIAANVSGNSGTTTKLATARSISLDTGVTSTATNFDGSANITIPVNSVKEAYLSWGGKNFSGSYGCIDAAMVPELGANRLAFIQADSIEILYSTDGGSTWLTYNSENANKINLFNGNNSTYYIGKSSEKGIDKSNYQLRIIVTTNIAQVYTVLNKFVIYCSTNGSTGCWCTIDAKTKSNVDSGTDTWVTFADKVGINGWSGYNVINTSGITTYGNNSSQYQKLRFTFGVTSHASTVTSAGLMINKIMGFGGVGWSTPSTMAATGRMYTYDSSKNVAFPAKVTATTFSGSLSGNASTASSAAKLTTARTINGTSFDGSANITTTNWGTARNVYIADSDTTNTGSAVSVNGSGDATLKLPATIKATLTGNASTATKLATARTFRTNLASTSTASFDGSANVTPGVTGVLPVANGGTGNSSVDTTPTDGSTKMVTSGGVYTALSEKQDTIPAWGGASEGSIILNGLFNTVAADYSTAEGYYTNAFGAYSHAEGYYTTALGENSHAEGYSTNAVYNQIPDLSTSTSNDDIITAWNSNKFSLAKSEHSHVEGYNCLALKKYSHAEGFETIASGFSSHAEGGHTKALYEDCHAEGSDTNASGFTSHAEGYCTIASGGYQHVQGKYNIEDTSSTYAHIVGNGTAEDARSNAYTLDWDGNGWYAGGLTVTSDLSVKTTIKPNVISWYTPSNEKYDEIQLRLSGSTGTQGISFVAYKNGSTVGFYNIISADGSTTLPGNLGVNGGKINNVVFSGLYYTKGQSFTLDGHISPCCITNAQRDIYFPIPLQKPLVNVSSVSISNLTMTLRQNGKYVVGSGSSYATPKGTISASINFGQIQVSIKSTTEFKNSINNDVGIAHIKCTVKFN